MITRTATTMSLALQAAIHSGGDEPDIVEAFCNGVKDRSIGTRTTIKAKFVHQKPYAYFVNPPKICDKKRCELGDILFIVKRTEGELTFDHRFTFAQVKKMSDGKAMIDVHQFKFMRDIPRSRFRFGKNVYANAGATPIEWNGLTPSEWFGHYLLLASSGSCACPLATVDTQYPGGCGAFPFRPDYYLSLPRPAGVKREKVYRPSFHSFLLSFMRLDGPGVAVNGAAKEFLSMVLKHNTIGWEADPPEETEEYFEDDRRGFGVVQITITDGEDGNIEVTPRRKI
jgi:hypothetical protein